MPGISNNFVTKVMRLVKELFVSDRFEYGTLDVTPADNDRVITIETTARVKRAWLSMTPLSNPYTEDHMGAAPTHYCFASECIPVPSGFQFKVQVHGECRVGWFAIGD